MLNLFLAVVRRDLMLALRQKSDYHPNALFLCRGNHVGAAWRRC